MRKAKDEGRARMKERLRRWLQKRKRTVNQRANQRGGLMSKENSNGN